MKIKQKFNKDKLWFTSDTHFCHENIITYCNRPFKNAEEMDKYLIEEWNKCVLPDDDIIIAGDFIHSGNIIQITNILTQLKGKIWLVMGNHDYQNKLDRSVIISMFDNKCFDSMDFQVKDDEFEDGLVKFHINHYPCEFWTRGAIHLHGHIHSGPKSSSEDKLNFKPLRYDIGVDNNNYRPISYDEVITIITKQQLGYK